MNTESINIYIHHTNDTTKGNIPDATIKYVNTTVSPGLFTIDSKRISIDASGSKIYMDNDKMQMDLSGDYIINSKNVLLTTNNDITMGAGTTNVASMVYIEPTY